MDNLIQWRNVAGANIEIFKDGENAGSSLCTIVVPDMTEARASLHAIGLRLSGKGPTAKLPNWPTLTETRSHLLNRRADIARGRSVSAFQKGENDARDDSGEGDYR